MTKEEFDNIVAILKAIPEEEVQRPTMPVNEFLQEASDKKYYAEKDQDRLLAAGLPVIYIESMQGRIDVLQELQSIWIVESQESTELAEQWKDTSQDYSNLHRVLIHDFKFAFRNYPEQKSLVDKIAEGSTIQDTAQDLSDLKKLAEKYPDPLQAINFDVQKLDQAAEKAIELRDLNSKIKGERNENDKPSKDLRDRAFTHLKEAVDQICEFGKYVFWEDKEKLENYSISYYKRNRKKKEEEAEELN